MGSNRELCNAIVPYDGEPTEIEVDVNEEEVEVPPDYDVNPDL
jgi:hypothetical protein